MPSILSEDELVARIAARFPLRPAATLVGIGDDAAQLAGAWDLVTCDTMCEGVHFDLAFASIGDAAFRCLTANLSDIAAMGGVPGPFTLSLAVPPAGLGAPAADALLDGLLACIDAHDAEHVWLVGGDVVRSSGGLVLTVTLLGRSPPPGPVLRSGARPGDVLCLFGPMGASAAGLDALRHRRQDEFPELARAYLRPVAQLRLGAALGAAACVSAMMDVSDGLALDLQRLGRASGVRLQVEAQQVPRDPELATAAAALGRSIGEYLLGGGEEFVLCATVPQAALEAADACARQAGAALFRIGEVCTGAGLSVYDAGLPIAIDGLGFRHFTPASSHDDDAQGDS